MTAYRTQLIVVDPVQPDLAALRPAAQALTRGELVAFPTETVYGLGADARNPRAVSAIFEAKGRPADNPLIVHVLTLEQLDGLVQAIPPLARTLFEAFSPGPMTLVLDKNPALPDVVTAQLDTVAVRIPAHPVARALIRSSGLALAAPSANRSGRPSPTLAWHVQQDLDGLIPYIIDGGPSAFGLESTVIDARGSTPLILRPGSLTAEALYEKTGLHARLADGTDPTGPAPDVVHSPGLKYRHYAPDARLLIATQAAKMDQQARAQLAKGRRVGLFASKRTLEQLTVPWWPLSDPDPIRPPEACPAFVYGPDKDPALAAHHLFDALRRLDLLGVQVILAEGFADEGLGTAYMNRLQRAAQVAEPGRLSVLFVCTGNTCRSPMAAALLRQLTAGQDVTVQSAGVFAAADQPASDLAIRVLADRYGLDLSDHRAQQLTQALVDQADLVLTMTGQHKASLVRAFPEQRDKIKTLGEAAGHADLDVPDPFGLDEAAYRKTAIALEELIRAWLDRSGLNKD